MRVDRLNHRYIPLDQEGQSRRDGELSAKTSVEHHRMISTVLGQEMKEKFVPLDVANCATLPKMEWKEMDDFRSERVAAIRESPGRRAGETKKPARQPLITSVRSGEVLSLKWDKVDF